MRARSLSRDVGETDPHQHGAGDMVSLDAHLATLTLRKTDQLLDLSMKLISMPNEFISSFLQVWSRTGAHRSAPVVIRPFSRWSGSTEESGFQRIGIGMARSPRAGLQGRHGTFGRIPPS